MEYSILIQWSEIDQAYVASLPEWGEYVRTHGDTYEEALNNATKVLEDLVYGYKQISKPLPEPQTLKSILCVHWFGDRKLFLGCRVS